MNSDPLIFIWVQVILFNVLTPAIGQGKISDLKGPYLGQETPGLVPEIFAPGIISTDENELNSVFTKDGTEFYFTRRVNKGLKIFWSKSQSDKWSQPEMISFSKILPDMDEVDMFFSNDETRLFYISNRPTDLFKPKSVNIFYSERLNENWSSPILIPAPINTDSTEVYPMIVANGSMYLASQRPGGFGQRDVYRSPFENGKFGEPVNLGPAINSEYNEGDIYVAPDESYLIASSWGRPDSHGRSDLYFSQRHEDGTWAQLINMGAPINSDQTDFCPIVSPDGKYFFFSRNGDIYWVDIEILEPFKQ